MLQNLILLVMLSILLAACSLVPKGYDPADPAAFAPMPHTYEGVRDARSRFREISCAVIEARKEQEPHYESCDQALRNLGDEPAASSLAVELGQAERLLVAAFVPGIGWECFENWMKYNNEFGEMSSDLGFESLIFSVDGLSGSAHNARQIRNQIIERSSEIQPQSLVMIGYSKGINDTLDAIVRYPEIHPYIAAVVSVAGAVGGSPLAQDIDENDLGLMKHIPDAACSDGDGKALEALLPAARDTWLAENQLPAKFPYYTLITLPEPEEVSNILHGSYRRLAKIDPRNDGQLIVSDQLVPNSTVLGYLNADHWAVAVPIAEEHPFIAGVFVDQNTFPRKSLAEAVLRFVEEDLGARANPDLH